MSVFGHSRPLRGWGVIALAVPLLVSSSWAAPADAAAPIRNRMTPATTSWFTDPLTPAQRAALVPVPQHPASVTGELQRTRAFLSTADGSLAVPVDQAVGHQLSSGQAVVLNRRDVVSVHTSAATRREVARLATSLRDVSGVRCEGYSTFGPTRRQESRLAVLRAAHVCALLAADRPGLETAAVGYGSRLPVLVGGTVAQRAHNRRVVVVALGSATRAPGAPSLRSATGGVDSATLLFSAPTDTGGSPITGYSWSTDRTRWHPMRTTGGSPYTVVLGSLTPGTATYYVRAVNASGPGAASAGRPATVTAPVVPTAPTVAGADLFCGTLYAWVNPGPVDSATVTGFEFSLDGGLTWTTAQNVQNPSSDPNETQRRFNNQIGSTCTFGGPPQYIIVRATSANGPGPASAPYQVFTDI